MRPLGFSLLIFGVFASLLSACTDKDEVISVETINIIETEHKSAKAGGKVISGENLNYRGLCWSTDNTPTIGKDRYSMEGTTLYLSSLLGEYTAMMTSLKPSTKYYFRAYVNSSSGQVAYGQTFSFTTLPSKGTVTDIEGNEYQTAQIGNQLWMAENLKTAHFSNGDSIPTTIPDTLILSSTDSQGYQWVYEGDQTNLNEYGRLYNWYIVIDSRNVCPSGWHIPDENDWNTLLTFLGGAETASYKLMEEGGIHWIGGGDIGDNSSDFTALPAGYRHQMNLKHTSFNGINSDAKFWSYKNVPEDTYSEYYFSSGDSTVRYQSFGISPNHANSIRCIKD